MSKNRKFAILGGVGLVLLIAVIYINFFVGSSPVPGADEVNAAAQSAAALEQATASQPAPPPAPVEAAKTGRYVPGKE